ncbi:FAD:protein FMN transferase [Sulfurimonas sp.]
MYKLIIILSMFSILNAQVILRTQIIMGTFVSISLDEKNKKEFSHAFQIMKKVEMSLSSYAKNEQIYKLNKYKTVQINSLTYEALKLSKKYYMQTDGYFDISVGSITKNLYKFGENETLPSKSSLNNALIKFQGLSFTHQRASIAPNITIDLGGMGKGFAVDKVSAYFKSKKIQKAIIAASGDIHCLDRCKIAVNNPFGKQNTISFKTKEKDMSISTSGNYNRYVVSPKYNHLINPKRKESQKNFVSITLISKMSNSDLDAYATAASVMPINKA